MLPLFKQLFPLKQVIHKIITYWILNAFLKRDISWMSLAASNVVLIHRPATSLLVFSLFIKIVFKLKQLCRVLEV